MMFIMPRGTALIVTEFFVDASNKLLAAFSTGLFHVIKISCVLMLPTSDQENRTTAVSG